MKKEFFIHIYILKLLIKNIISNYAYFDCQINCANDYPLYIIDPEENIKPKVPLEVCHKYRTGDNFYHIYNFEKVKRNLEEKICILWVNCRGAGNFAFQYVSMNEYIITIVDYEDWYSCDDCNYIATDKKFMTSQALCPANYNPLIEYSNAGNYFNTIYSTFCLEPRNDITNFYIDDSKINTNYYMGKTVKYFIYNNDTLNIPIKDLFIINGFENLEIILDTISLEISNIQNGKGKIFNGNEELSEGSFFNPNISLTFQNKINEGYLMIISIKTKPRNRPSSVSTCVNEAKIYLYVSQENCTMDEASDNYCQKCRDEYGKNGGSCYHRSEKFTNLYYDEQSQTFKQCEINDTIYNCSICPEGTHINGNNFFSSTCKKCPEWKYTDNVDQDECISCHPHCIECDLKGICLKCNNNALNGLNNCSRCENEIEWEYNGEFCKSKCSKYFYRDNSNIHCIQEIDECPEDMKYLNLETGECRKEVSDIEIIKGKYQLKVNESELENEADNLFKKAVNDKDLFNEIPKNGIKIEGYNEIINMGIVNNDTIKTDSRTINLGECPHLLRLNLGITGSEQNLLYQCIELKVEDTTKSIRFYNSEYLDKPKNISYCENQNITEIYSKEDVLSYLKDSKNGNNILRFIEQGLDIFNAYSPIYNDPCYPLSTINKVDLTLNDRREDMIKINITLCKPGCSFEGFNYKELKVLCFCKVNVNPEDKTISDGFTESFKNLGKTKNIMVFECGKKIFNFESQKYNYISEIFILFLIIEIICAFNCERGIKKYIKYMINFSLKNPKENNDDSIILVNYNGNDNDSLFAKIMLTIMKLMIFQ